MEHIGRQAAALLNAAGIELGPGLTEVEFDSVHARFGFHFNPDHRSLLSTALPLGDRWPDWRNSSDLELETCLDSVAEGFIWDALHQDPPFWPPSWGTLPSSTENIAITVRQELRRWPRLIPIYAHRFTPAAPTPPRSPVFSVWQTDIIYYGADLLEYLANEFPLGQGRKTLSPITVRIPYWSRFVESANTAESI
ncbi:hypothetical protein B2J88_38165 [Rhodococcus sp. SRB_17]|nr:hypothetical protein [Rhodococcus sp. SRB_17]